MNKNNQPIILGAMVIGAVLIIVLVLIFTRGGDDTATETASENNTAENQESENAEEGSGDSQQPETPEQPVIPEQPDNPAAPEQPDNPAAPEQPDNPAAPEQPDNPETDILPSNWNQLTDGEKIALNPLDCDLITQTIWANDGSCHDKEVVITEPLLDYTVLNESLFNSCENYQVGTGICGARAVVTISHQPSKSEAKEIALEFAEKYGSEENIWLTILRYNGSDNIDDYHVYGIGYGPIFNQGHKCGEYRAFVGGTGAGGWIERETWKCQTVASLEEGYFTEPQAGFDDWRFKPSPLRYVEDSLEVTCDKGEASFCQIKLEVILLEDIDTTRRLENRYTLPGFITPGIWNSRQSEWTSDRCLGISTSFFDSFVHENRITFACHDDQLPDIIRAGGRYIISGPVGGIPDGGSITLKTAPEVTITDIKVNRVEHF